jgi:hypothetical protein
LPDYNLGRAYGEIEITADTRGAQEAQAAMAATAAEAEVLDKSMTKVNRQFDENRRKTVMSAEGLVRERGAVEDLRKVYERYNQDAERAAQKRDDAQRRFREANKRETIDTAELLRLGRETQRLKDNEERLVRRAEDAHARYQTRLSSLRQEVERFNQAHTAMSVGFRNMRRDAEEMGNALTKLSEKMAGLVKVLSTSGLYGLFGAGAGGLLGVAGSSGLQGMTVAMGGVLEVVKSFAGAMLLLPAGVEAAVVSLGTLKVAFHGVAEAIEASMTDPTKFIESLRQLSPAARDVAIQFAQFSYAFRGARQMIQEATFQPIIDQIRPLVYQWLPELMHAGQQIGNQFGQAMRQVFQFFQGAQAQQGFQTFIQNLVNSFQTLRGAIQPFMQAWTTLASTGSQVFGRLAQAVVTVANEFNNWVQKASQSGELIKRIDNAIDSFTRLFHIIRDIGIGIANFFDIGQSVGGDFLTLIAKIAAEFKAWTESAKGQASILNFFVLMKQAAETMHPLWHLLGEAIGTVVGAFVRLGTSIGGGLQTFFQDLVDSLKFLAPILQQMAPALNEFFRDLGSALKTIVQDLGPHLPQFFQDFADALHETMYWLPGVSHAFGELFSHLTPHEIEALTGLVIAIKGLNTVMAVLGPAMTLLSNPLTLVVGGLALLAVGVTYIITHWDKVKQQVGEVTEKFGGLHGILDGVKNAWNGLTDLVSRWWNTVISAIAGGWDSLVGGLNELKNKLIHWWDNINLIDIGKKLIKSLADGILAAIPTTLKDALKAAGDAIVNFWKPGSPAKEGPLHDYSPDQMGESVTDNYAAGIASGTPAVESASGQVAGGAARGLSGSAAGGGGLAPGGGGPGYAQGAGTAGGGGLFTSGGMVGVSGRGISGFDAYVKFLTDDMSAWLKIAQDGWSLFQNIVHIVQDTTRIVADLWNRGDNPLTRQGGLYGPPLPPGGIRNVPGVPNIPAPGRPPDSWANNLPGALPSQARVPGVPNIGPFGAPALPPQPAAPTQVAGPTQQQTSAGNIWLGGRPAAGPAPATAGAAPGTLPANPNPSQVADYIYKKARSEGFSPADATAFVAQAYGESSLGQNNYGATTGDASGAAQGVFQFTPGTWTTYGGGGDVMNPQQNIDAYFNMFRQRVAAKGLQGRPIREQIAGASVGGPAVENNVGVPWDQALAGARAALGPNLTVGGTPLAPPPGGGQAPAIGSQPNRLPGWETTFGTPGNTTTWITPGVDDQGRRHEGYWISNGAVIDAPPPADPSKSILVQGMPPGSAAPPPAPAAAPAAPPAPSTSTDKVLAWGPDGRPQITDRSNAGKNGWGPVIRAALPEEVAGGAPSAPPPQAPAAPAQPAVAAGQPAPGPPGVQAGGQISANQWPYITDVEGQTVPVLGGAKLAKGAPATILNDFLTWFNQNIEPVTDTGGYRPGMAEDFRIRSQHLSGTAIDINPNDFPGFAGGVPSGARAATHFTPEQIRLIRERLATYGGAIEWGEDWDRADPMHFQLTQESDGGLLGPMDPRTIAAYNRIIAQQPAPPPTTQPAQVQGDVQGDRRRPDWFGDNPLLGGGIAGGLGGIALWGGYRRATRGRRQTGGPSLDDAINANRPFEDRLPRGITYTTREELAARGGYGIGEPRTGGVNVYRLGPFERGATEEPGFSIQELQDMTRLSLRGRVPRYPNWEPGAWLDRGTGGVLPGPEEDALAQIREARARLFANNQNIAGRGSNVPPSLREVIERAQRQMRAVQDLQNRPPPTAPGRGIPEGPRVFRVTPDGIVTEVPPNVPRVGNLGRLFEVSPDGVTTEIPGGPIAPRGIFPGYAEQGPLQGPLAPPEEPIRIPRPAPRAPGGWEWEGAPGVRGFREGIITPRPPVSPLGAAAAEGGRLGSLLRGLGEFRFIPLPEFDLPPLQPGQDLRNLTNQPVGIKQDPRSFLQQLTDATKSVTLPFLGPLAPVAAALDIFGPARRTVTQQPAPPRPPEPSADEQLAALNRSRARAGQAPVQLPPPPPAAPVPVLPPIVQQQLQTGGGNIPVTAANLPALLYPAGTPGTQPTGPFGGVQGDVRIGTGFSSKVAQGSAPVTVTNPQDLPGGGNAPPPKAPPAVPPKAQPPPQQQPQPAQPAQAPGVAQGPGGPRPQRGLIGQDEAAVAAGIAGQPGAGGGGFGGGLQDTRTPMQQFTAGMEGIAQIVGDGFKIFGDIIQNIKATAQIMDIVAARGVENTEDIVKVIEGMQTFLTTAADIAKMVGDTASAIGKMIPSTGGADFGGAESAQAVLSAISSIASIVQGAIETVNEGISLGIEIYHEVGKYAGYLFGAVLGGSLGTLGGNVRMLLNTRTGQIYAYSEDNPLNKNVINTPFAGAYNQPSPIQNQNNQMNIYTGPGQSPMQMMQNTMWMVSTGAPQVASVAAGSQ